MRAIKEVLGPAFATILVKGRATVWPAARKPVDLSLAGLGAATEASLMFE